MTALHCRHVGLAGPPPLLCQVPFDLVRVFGFCERIFFPTLFFMPSPPFYPVSRTCARFSRGDFRTTYRSPLRVPRFPFVLEFPRVFEIFRRSFSREFSPSNHFTSYFPRTPRVLTRFLWTLFPLPETLALFPGFGILHWL